MLPGRAGLLLIIHQDCRRLSIRHSETLGDSQSESQLTQLMVCRSYANESHMSSDRHVSWTQKYLRRPWRLTMPNGWSRATYCVPMDHYGIPLPGANAPRSFLAAAPAMPAPPLPPLPPPGPVPGLPMPAPPPAAQPVMPVPAPAAAPGLPMPGPAPAAASAMPVVPNLVPAAPAAVMATPVVPAGPAGAAGPAAPMTVDPRVEILEERVASLRSELQALRLDFEGLTCTVTLLQSGQQSATIPTALPTPTSFGTSTPELVEREEPDEL